nr:right-handed parallel beta-helix repeat-containing protein [uncultured Dyadobacter sp.]
MRTSAFMHIICLLLVLYACKQDEVTKDECTTDPTACGCPDAPPSCPGPGPGNENPGTVSGKIYVAPNGDDSNDGTESKPLRSIQAAADKADPEKGLEIILRGGNYESREIVFRTSHIYLHSYPGEWAVIRAVTNVEDIASCLWFREPGTTDVTLENLEIVGGYYYGIKLESNWDYDNNIPFDQRKGISEVKILHCKIHDTGRDCIKITPGCKDIQILNCEIYRSGVGPANIEANNAEGIDNVNADQMIVRNCYIHDIATNALYAKGGARQCIFEQNLIMNCGEGGLVAGYLDTDVEWFNTTANPDYFESIGIIIRNNIVAKVGREGIGLYAAKDAQVYHNTLVDVAREDGSAALLIARGEIYGTPKGDIHPGCRDVKVVNNIIVQSSQARGYTARLRGSLSGNNEITQNIYYRPGNHLFRLDTSEDDYLELEGFENWKSRTAFDGTSVITDPLLDTQYHLAAGSPCIGKGKNPGSVVAKDYDGRSRTSTYDIGADQSGNGAALAIPPAPLATGTSGTGGKD